MSLRSSLGNVLRENGQIYGTDLKKLREYSAGNFEGMYSEPDPEMDMLLGDVQMEAIENEGFMSDELPKFSKGGGIFKKTKDFSLLRLKQKNFLHLVTLNLLLQELCPTLVEY